MDESVQKVLDNAEGTPLREHWVWMGGSITGPRCQRCDMRYPQSRELCVEKHMGVGGRPDEDGGPRLDLEFSGNSK